MPAKPLILLVEAHPDTREIFTWVLITAGFDVHATAQGTEALRVLRTKPVAAVVLDIGRDGSGFMLAEAMRALRRSVRLIATTGRMKTGDIRETLFDAYLLTPVLADDLVSAVTTIAPLEPPDSTPPLASEAMITEIAALLLENELCRICIAAKADVTAAHTTTLLAAIAQRVEMTARAGRCDHCTLRRITYVIGGAKDPVD